MPAAKPVRAFFISTLALLVVVFLLTSPPAAENPFALPLGTRVDLDELSVQEVADLKLRHLAASPPYDILLLGNSRTMPVSAEGLGLSPDRFFNMTLSGQSFRAQVLLLEEISRMGKKPRVAILTFDNSELQYYGNPYWAEAVVRWRQMFADLCLLGVPLPDRIRMLRRHVVVEWDQFVQRLSLDRVWRGARLIFLKLNGMETSYPRAEYGWSHDGSREPPPPERPYQPHPIPTANHNVLPAYLEYDMHRLGQLAARGISIIIVEPFLNPETTRLWLTPPTPQATSTRQHWLRECAHQGISCLPSPGVFADGGSAWRDADHPPTAAITHYVKNAIKESN